MPRTRTRWPSRRRGTSTPPSSRAAGFLDEGRRHVALEVRPREPGAACDVDALDRGELRQREDDLRFLDLGSRSGARPSRVPFAIVTEAGSPSAPSAAAATARVRGTRAITGRRMPRRTWKTVRAIGAGEIETVRVVWARSSSPPSLIPAGGGDRREGKQGKANVHACDCCGSGSILGV